MSIEIIRLKDDEKLFFIRWNEYLNSHHCSVKFMPKYIEILKFASNLLIRDESFVVIQNNSCAGICFLPIEKNQNLIQISLGGGFSFAPLGESKKIYDLIFAEIFEISKRLNVSKIMFCIDMLAYTMRFNLLVKYGFIDTSTNTCVVKLDESKENRWREIKGNYKTLINRVLKNSDFEIVIMNDKNQDYAIHENYRLLHEKCSGRQTRGKMSFDRQYELLKDGFATIIALKFKGKFIGMCYFMHHFDSVVYFSGADDPDYNDKKLTIYHPILWSANEYFSKLGYKVMEFGQPCEYSDIVGFMNYCDTKQTNIGYFKRGMGAKMVSFYKAIKYFDQNLLLNDIENFKNIVAKGVE